MPNLGGPEILLIIAVLVLLFGATRLPKMAAGLGEALRIFKKEVRTKDDDSAKTETEAPAAQANPPAITHTSPTDQVPAQPVTQPVQETAKDAEHTNR
jgi:sec-independent protein translocase protein TatA